MSGSGAAVQELEESNYRATLAGAPLAFVDVYASWCGPCRLFSPTFDAVAAKHPEAKFFKIDGDLHPGSRSDLSIDNLPYVAVYRSGKLVKGVSLATEEALEELIAKIAGGPA